MASHTKPPIVCYLKEGKAVGAHKDFAKTFNWLVDWCWNFRTGRGIKFEHVPDSAHPRISLDEDDDGGGGGGDITFAAEPGCNVTFRKDGNTIYVGVYWA